MRVIDYLIKRGRLDGHAGPAGNAAVVQSGLAALRIDGVAQGHLLAYDLAELVGVLRPEARQGKSSVAEPARGWGLGPLRGCDQCGRSEPGSAGAG